MLDSSDTAPNAARTPQERTQRLAGHPADEDMLLPSLDDGVTLLSVEGARGVQVLQSLVVDHLLVNDGVAGWVDASGHATTTTLARLAPSTRLLDRILVARGFTAYQHYATVCDLPATIATDHTPTLLVAPAIDAQYRGDDTLGYEQAQRLQTRALACLAAYGAEYDIPVLVTCSDRDAFTDPVEAAADHRLCCEQTEMGPRFVGEAFETLVYPVGDGRYYQTTLSYWRDLLGARARQVGVAGDSPAPSMEPEDGVGRAVTASGDPAPLTASPVLDAWQRGQGGR